MVKQGRESELREWIPIADGTANAYAYSETIYGNGHTIRGLYVGANSDSLYVGLIGRASKAKIQNLRIADSYFEVSHTSVDVANPVGAFCAYSGSGSFTDCYNEATVVSSNRIAGGIVGQADCDRFTRCGNGGTIELLGQSDSSIIGGIVGVAAAEMVTGSYATAQCEFEKCFNVGTLKYSGSSEDIWIGSITGDTDFGKYTNCYYDSSKCSDICGVAGRTDSAILNPTITECEGISNESQFRNGSVCEKIGHLYFGGECVICGNKCDGHNFSGTSCTKCGMGFVMVTGMDANLPANIIEGNSVTLTGTVYPSNASYQDITWSVVSGNATINDNTVTFNKMGTVVLRATIKNGFKVGKDYTQDFSVIVRSTSNYDISQVSGTSYDYRMTITESDGKLAVKFDGETYYVDLDTSIIVTGSKTGDDNKFGITVEDTSQTVNIILKNCTIQSEEKTIEIKNSDLNLTLEGSNSLVSGLEAISVGNTSSIVIDGTGSLKAQSTGSCPAIGCSYGVIPGDITINGGTITANGGISSAGIGSYYNTSSGKITINAGNVTATGGVGTPSRVGGGAGIGGGAEASGGTIIINGGTVNATGGDAYENSGKNATGGAAGIGGGYVGRSGNITINGGFITATGSEYGTGIGSGQAHTLHEGEDLIDTIKITGGTITAKGLNLGSGIGGGSKAYGGKIIITGGNIKAFSERGNAIGKGSGSPSNCPTSVTDNNGNSVSKVTYTIDGATADTAVTAITGCDYGVKDVSVLDTNKLYFYLPSGADVATVSTKDGEYICKIDNTFYKDHEYSSDCDDICNHCGERRSVSTKHDYENEICKNCGAYWPAVLNESGNYYEIYTAAQLFWFADTVNAGETDISGKLMADIDASSLASLGIGSKNKKYAGIFDGNGHSIKISLNGSESVALFPYVNGATIKNLTVNGSITASGKFAASFVGQTEGDVTIEKCISNVEITSTVSGDGTHGGLVGVVNSGTTAINNCGFAGTINGSDTTSCGGFVGWSNGTTKISNSFVAATFGVKSDGGNTFSRGNNITVTNCYYLNALNSTPNEATQKDETAFNSGEVAYKLNNGVTDGTQAWYQTITGDEKQNYPSFSGKTVYGSDDQYANATIVTITGVTGKNGEYNGLTHTGYTGTPTNADGYTGTYEIKYTGRNGTTYSSTEAPTNAGDYTVTISTDSKELMYAGSVTLDFSISKKAISVVASEQKIGKGEELSTEKVTVSGLCDGHEATVEAALKSAECTYVATIVIKDAKRNDVTANYDFDATGIYHEYEWDTLTQEYRCINCRDLNSTDTTPPTAEYQIGESGFKKFVNKISFGLFCKKYQTVEITAEDDNSGVDTVKYFISSTECSETDLEYAVWKAYEKKINLDAKGTYIVYVKVTDKAGNTAIYNSEGIVIFEDSTPDFFLTHTRTDKVNVSASIDFKGNTVKEIKYGDRVLTEGTDYEVRNNSIIFKGDFLETFPYSETPYILRVSYNALGVEWGENSYGEKPADTVISLTIELQENRISYINSLDKVYDGKPISNPSYTALGTGKATYEYKKQGEDDSEFTATAPKDVGKYVVRVTVAADDNYGEARTSRYFSIDKAPVTVKADDLGKIYGSADPTLTWRITAGELFGSDELKGISLTRVKGEDVDRYAIYVAEEPNANPNYEVSFSIGVFTIEEKTLGIEWSDTEFTYDGSDKLPKATPTGTEFGDVITFTVVGEQKNAGTDYTATVTAINGEKKDNYVLPNNVTTKFVINKAEQAAPDADKITATPEDIDGRENGTIAGLNDKMEYRKDSETEYTAIAGTQLSNLADGTYYIRFKENDNYKPSADTAIKLSNDKKLIVTVPETQIGYTLSVDKTELSWEEDVTASFAVAEGYSKLDGFAVNANGKPIELDENGRSTVAKAQTDINLTVDGVADITPPEASIILGDNIWSKFYGSVASALYFKTAQSFEITADDKGSGVNKIYYHLAENELSDSAVKSLADGDWVEYTHSVSLPEQSEYIIYAKAVDNDGNTAYIGSEQRIVIDDIAPVISGIEDGQAYCDRITFLIEDRNIDKVTVDGVPVELNNGEYTITADNSEHIITAIDKSGNSTSVKITVSEHHYCIGKCTECGYKDPDACWLIKFFRYIIDWFTAFFKSCAKWINGIFGQIF